MEGWYFTRMLYCLLVSYTAVFSVVTQRSSAALRDYPKNGCVAD